MTSARLPALAYFACVALVTALGIGAAMALRPALAHNMRALVGLESEPQAARDSFYAVRVAPLLDARCAGCHGARRQKGQLRLDSFAAVMRGGRHGAAILPGDAANSMLITRISLPASDDKAMPPSGKTPLTADEVTGIRLWIAAGASGVQKVVPGAPRPVAQVQIPEIDPQVVQSQRAALAPTVKQLQSRLPGVIDYISRSSADLEIDASLKGSAFGDAHLAALAPLQARIVRADFSGTAITDASAPAIAAMSSLQVLRLMNTRVTDIAVQPLASLKLLHSLTVAGTGVSEKALAPLRRRGVAVYGGGDAH